MNTKQLDSEIRSLIDQFTSKFHELLGLAALGSIQMALAEGVGTPIRRGPGRPRGTAKSGSKRGPGGASAAKPASGRRTRRSSADVEAVADQVLTFVRTNPGSRLEEIGRGLGTETARLKLPVKELMATGRLRTEGQKRGTRYFVGSGGGGGAARRRAARRGKAKASRKARRTPRRKAGKRGRRQA